MEKNMENDAETVAHIQKHNLCGMVQERTASKNKEQAQD